jgi:rod shape-determining protein MreC
VGSYRRILNAAIVMALVAVPFFVLRANVRGASSTSSADRAILTVTAPLQYAAGVLARGLSNLWGDYAWLVDVKENNEKLAYENARLKDRVRRLEQAETDSRRLRKLLGLRDSLPGDMVSAQVIAKDLNPFFRVATVAIDRAGHDLRPNMPVVAHDGVVGKVQRVAGDRVDVLLAVDSRSGIDVLDATTGARGFALGLNDDKRYACKIEYVQHDDEVNVGDLLVTSGVGRAFPKGIPVARVSKVVRREYGVYQEVEAEPAVDFSRLEEVLVLVSPPGDDLAAPPARGVR